MLVTTTTAHCDHVERTPSRGVDTPCLATLEVHPARTTQPWLYITDRGWTTPIVETPDGPVQQTLCPDHS